MNNIYFTSDLHLFHNNIIKYCDRPFIDAEEMNNIIISNWNNTVDINDEIYLLGDFGLGKPSDLIKIMKELNGKIYFIRGNHDKNTIKANNKIHRFEWVKEQFELKIRDSEVADGIQRIILNHYPMLRWNKMHKGTWQLYGHIHTLSSRPQPLEGFNVNQLDVGVDNHNFYPISYNEVKIIITKQNLNI